MSKTTAPSAPLRYGCRITLYEPKHDGYVVCTNSAAAPVGLQALKTQGNFPYENAIFSIEPSDAVEITSALRSEGDFVRYGHTIKLVHQTHQQALSYQRSERAAGLKSNRRVLLENEKPTLDNSDRWNIIPRFRLRVEGEVVNDGDAIVLRSSQGLFCVNVADDIGYLGDDAFREVSCGTQLGGFQINLYDNDVGNPYSASTIRCGDYVVMMHTSSSKTIHANLDKKQCYLHAPDNTNGGDDNDVHNAPALEDAKMTLVERRYREYKDCIARSASLVLHDQVHYKSIFIVEAADPHVGGALKGTSDSLYRFKTVAGGLYMQVGSRPIMEAAQDASATASPKWLSRRGSKAVGSGQPKANGDDESGSPDDKSVASSDLSQGVSENSLEVAGTEGDTFEIVLTDDATAKGTLFAIAESSSADGALVCSGNRVLLKAVDTDHGDLWLSAGFPIKEECRTLEKSLISAEVHGGVQGHLGDISLCVRPLRSMREGLAIRRCPVLGAEMNMMRGLFPPLEKFVSELTSGECNFYRVEDVKINLYYLRRLCHEGTQAADVEDMKQKQNMENGVLNPIWQKKLFEQEAPQLVLHVAQAIIQCAALDPQLLFSTKPLPKPKKPVETNAPYPAMSYNTLGELVNDCFAFVQQSLKGCSKFALQLADFEDFLVESVQIAPSALRLLGTMYRDNPMYVELPAREHRLNFFLNTLISLPHNPDALKVVERFAVCNDEANPTAQQIIMDFLSNPEHKKVIMCPIRSGLSASSSTDETWCGLTNKGSQQMSPISGRVLERKETDGMYSERDSSTAPKKKTTGNITVPNDESPFSSVVFEVGIPTKILKFDTSYEAELLSTMAKTEGSTQSLNDVLIGAAKSDDTEGFTFIPLDRLKDLVMDWAEVRNIFIPYFAQLVALLGTLASGRNKSVCEKFIYRWIPRDAITVVMQSDALPRRVHAAFVNLFAYAVVDLGDNRLNLHYELQNLHYVMNKDTKPAAESYRFVADRIPAVAKTAKTCIERFFETQQMSGDAGIVYEYASSLRLIDVLLNAGFYSFGEYEALVRLLVSALNPATDDKNSALETQPVHDVKRIILDLLNSITDIVLARDAMKLIDQFRDGEEWPHPGQLIQLSETPTIRDLAREAFKKDAERREEKREKKQRSQPSKKTSTEQKDEGEEKEKYHVRPELRDMADVFKSLVDVAAKTKSARLRKHAILLYFRLTNYMGELYKSANSIQLLISASSVGFYKSVNKMAIVFKSICEDYIRKPGSFNQICGLLDTTHRMLDAKDNGPRTEKLTVLNHVEFPEAIVTMLARLPHPLKNESRTVLTKAFNLLLAISESDVVKDTLRKSCAIISSFSTEGREVITLLRRLYTDSLDEKIGVPPSLITNIVQCLAQRRNELLGVQFLQDLLNAPNVSVQYVMENQLVIWQACVTNSKAAARFHFNPAFIGERGSELRKQIITRPECFAKDGRLQLHLAYCHLVFLITNNAKLVSPEAVRHELFGVTSIDTILEVAADLHLPVFFRKAYVELVDALILNDTAALSGFFNSRFLNGFLHISMLDIVRYLTICGCTGANPEMEKKVAERDANIWRCEPKSTAQKKLDEQWHGVDIFAEMVFKHICVNVQRLVCNYNTAAAHLETRECSTLTLRINESIDLLCDVAKYALQAKAGTCPRHKKTPQVSSSLESLKSLHECLKTAKGEAFKGTARWRGKAFDELYSALEDEIREASSPEKRGKNKDDTESDRSSGKRRHASKTKEKDSDSDDSSREDQDDDQKSSQEEKNSTEESAGEGDENEESNEDEEDAWRANVDAANDERTNLQKETAAREDHTEELKEADEKAKGDRNALTSAWMQYMTDTTLKSAYKIPENSSMSAAGIILRVGDLGAHFMKTLWCAMPLMNAEFVERVLELTRVIVVLRPNNPFDESVLLPFGEVTQGKSSISIDMSLISRQSILSSWPGDSELDTPIPLIALVCHFITSNHPSVRSTALAASTTLMSGGHRGMQESLYEYCRAEPDTPLFFVIRNDMSLMYDEFSNYANALDQGSSPMEAAYLLPHIDDGKRELILLQLMCAGRYDNLQIYLLAQEGSTISVNLVECLVNLSAIAPHALTEASTNFFLQLFTTLSEMLQGPCIPIQDNLVAYNAPKFLTILLGDPKTRLPDKVVLENYEIVPKKPRKGEKLEPSIEELRQKNVKDVQTAAITTLLALIEGRHDHEFIERVVSTVDLSILGKAMDTSAREFADKHGPIERVHSSGFLAGDFKGTFRLIQRFWHGYRNDDSPRGRERLKDELAIGIGIYIFFRSCYDTQTLATIRARRSGEGKTKLLTLSVDQFTDVKGKTIKETLRKTESYKKLRHKLAKIEIIRNGKIERAYFRVLDCSEDFLYKGTRESIIREAVRTSDNERIQYFFNKSIDCIEEINVYFNLRKSIVLYFMNFFYNEVKLIALVLVGAINVIMVIGIRAPISPYWEGTPAGINITLKVLGISLIVVQGISTLQAIIGPAWVNLAVGWNRWRGEQEQRIAKMSERDIAADRGELLRHDRKAVHPPLHILLASSLWYIVSCKQLQEHGFFLFVSFMGYFQHRIWWAFQLMQISINTPVLDHVFSALLQSGWILAFTFILFIMVLFFYATVTYYFFSELFDPTGSKGNGFNCFTLSQCWLVHLDLLRGAGIGDVAEWPTFYSKDGFGYWFAFYRLTFYIVVTLIVSNLFYGLVFDALGALRQQRQQIMQDQTSKCFICGTPRNKFDILQPGLYETHIEEEHNMWSYLFFLYYLSEKDPDTVTGQESYVNDLVRLRDVTFYPIGLSSSLASNDDGDGQENPDEEEDHDDGGPPEGPKPTNPAEISSIVSPVQKQLEKVNRLLQRFAANMMSEYPSSSNLNDTGREDACSSVVVPTPAANEREMFSPTSYASPRN